jgi:hypothetical protein
MRGAQTPRRLEPIPFQWNRFQDAPVALALTNQRLIEPNENSGMKTPASGIRFGIVGGLPLH